ncbi:MAG TPA: Crp/Fnr family transcriptional regulator [Terriglobales bacterium]|nr:Crp/Fnr family transcriptional regulator [Terriglobales bacterium]
MLNAEMISTGTPHCYELPDVKAKAYSPYGLPIVDNCVNCKLRSSNFFCSLAPEAMKALNQIKHVTSYPEGAMVFLEGQSARGVYLLCQGRVKLMTANSEGKTLILKIAEPGEILGLQSVVGAKAHELTGETLQPCQLAFIASEDLLNFLKEYGEACLHAAQHLSRDCQSAYDLIRSIGLSHSVSERLARLVLQLSGSAPANREESRVKVALTHEEIAQLIGASRETVTRTLSEFKKHKLMEFKGATMLIRDRNALEKIANA